MTNVAHIQQAGNGSNGRRLQAEVARHLAGGVPFLALALAWGGPAWASLGAAAAAYAAVAAVALHGLARHAPHPVLGSANRVSLTRGLLVAVAAGALPNAAWLPAAAQWTLAAIGFLALLLDGLDGWLARRSGMASDYGAGLDAELDTVTIVVLALLVWRLGDAGPWVLALALLRPVFVVAGRLVPALARPLPPSGRRRAICGIQIAVLAACLTPALQPPWSGFASGTALALLIFSFGVDTVWLLSRPAPGPHPAKGSIATPETDR